MVNHAAALPRLFDRVGVGGWGETKQTDNNREVVARSWTQQLTGMERGWQTAQHPRSFGLETGPIRIR